MTKLGIARICFAAAFAVATYLVGLFHGYGLGRDAILDRIERQDAPEGTVPHGPLIGPSDRFDDGPDAPDFFGRGLLFEFPQYRPDKSDEAHEPREL